MSKKSMVRNITAGVLLVCCSCSTKSPQERFGDSVKGIILISIDTLRADALGCYGGTQAATPVIDRLASEGTLYRHCIAPSPLTLPSHATLLSGLHPLSHGLLSNSTAVLPEPVLTLPERLRDSGWVTAAVVSSAILHRKYGLNQGFDDYRDDFFSSMMEKDKGEIFAEAGASRTTDQAIDWLDRKAGENPFFLFIHYIDPHFPYSPPPPYDQQYAANPYYGEVAYLDAQIGRLLDFLEKRQLEEGLLVAITSDHGESLGAHGERSHGVFLYDTVLRIPLILRGAGIAAGRLVDQAVGLADIMPTLLAMAGLEAQPQLPGIRIDAADLPDRGQVSVSYLPSLSYGWSPQWSLWQSGEKFILSPEKEYYRLTDDPSERNNLAGQMPQNERQLEVTLRQRAQDYLQNRLHPRPIAVDVQTRQQLAALGYGASSNIGKEDNLEDFSGADPKDKKRIFQLFEKYYVAFASQNHDQAGKLLETIIQEDPDNLSAQREFSLNLLLRGDYQGLIDWLAAKPDWFLEDSEQQYLKAKALAGLNRPQEAIDLLKDILARDPLHWQSRFEWARIAASQNRNQEAIGIYGDLLKDDPMNRAGRYNLANLLAKANDFKGAEEQYLLLVKQYPGFAKGHRNLGYLYYLTKNKSAAVKHLEIYLKLAPLAADRRQYEGLLRQLRSGG